MSLIADALKAAQQEKTKRMPAPSAPGMGGFFAVRSGARKRDGMPRPLVLTLIAVGAIGLVAALVTLLLSTAKPPPPLAASQPTLTPAPIVAPTVSTPAPLPITDSASAIPVAAAATPAPAGIAGVAGASAPTTAPGAPILATGAPLVATKPIGDTPRSVVASADTFAVATPAPKPAGMLKITMEDQPALDSRPLFMQALTAQRRGDTNRAKELYARALERDPQNADLYNNIGMLYKSTGESDRAEDAYRHAVSLNPKLAAAWSNLGVLLSERGRRKEAIGALQQAITVDPTNVGVKVNLALQYHASGLYADARRLLEEAVKASPTMAEAQYALARTLEAQGDRSSAIQHYDLFLSTSNGRFPPLERQVTQHLATLKAGS